MATQEHEPKDSAAAARARTVSLVGQVISNRYRIEELLAMGGMGAVYRGQHLLMHKRIAIKILHPDIENLPELVARFEREAVAGAHVQHPNVAAVTDFGVLDDGSYFLVLEYVRGITLSQLMRQGPVPAPRALRIARQLAAGLEAAHAMGIVHRDVKPRNVMLVEGKADVVKLIDFGLAKIDTERLSTLDQEQGEAAPPRLTVGGVIFGTIAYLAPEAALGMDLVDSRSDLYALGVILYEMLAGDHLFDAVEEMELFQQHRTAIPRSLRERVPGAEIPDALEAVVMRLLEKEPDRRYASATELIAALDAVAPGVGGGQKAAMPSQPAPISAAAFTVAGVPSVAAPSLAAPPLCAPAPAAKPTAIEKPALAERRGRRAKRAAPAEARQAEGQPATRSRERSRIGIVMGLVVGALAILAFARDCGQTRPAASPVETATAAVAPAPSSAAAAPIAAPSPSPDTSAIAPAPSPAVDDVPEVEGARAQLLKSAATKRWDPGAAALVTLAERAPGSLGARALIGAARDVAAALERHPSPQTERVFSALEHDFGTDGLDVLYALVETNGAGLGGRRALASLRDSAIVARATPALRIAFALREAPCNEKLDLLDRAVAEGDARALGVLQTFGRGCFPRNNAVEAAIGALRAKLPKAG